jgi:small-conductance mechanosensitive channel
MHPRDAGGDREPLRGARFDRCHFVDFSPCSLDFELVYDVASSQYAMALDVQQRINLDIVRHFTREGLDFALPSRGLQLIQPSQAGA